jgi:CheY-like chemotaxis protein/tetratricopeptide (TPR) repeat protein
MAKQSILLIDPNQRSLSVMEPSLRKFGYEVQCALSRAQAESFIQLGAPDLIVSEVAIADGSAGDESGVAFCSALKAIPALANVPFVVVTDREEAKVRALGAGAETFLLKPVYMGELKSVIEAALQRRQRKGLEQSSGERFFGRLEEMGLFDLLQVIDVSRRSGELSIEHRGQRGRLWFKDGELLDAEMGHLRGVDAIYRLLTWEFGQYEFDFNAPARPRQIKQSVGVVREEGLRRLGQWNQMCDQLPSLDTVFRVDRGVLSDRGEPLTAEMSAILSLFNGRRTTQEVIDAASLSDLESLKALTELYFEGIINEVREARSAQPVVGDEFVDPSANRAPLAASSASELPVGATVRAVGGVGRHDFSLPNDEDEPPEPFDLLSQLRDESPPPALPDLEPPPLTADLKEAPYQDDESQGLLADLYASVAGQEPPPVPTTPQEPLSKESYNTYSDLFGEGYTFDESEQDFFGEPPAGAAEVPLKPERAPASPAAKFGFMMLGLIFAAILALIFRDQVKPLKITQTTSDRAVWYEEGKIALRSQHYALPELSVDWRIERAAAEISDLAGELAADLGGAPKGREVSGQDKKRVLAMIKEAQGLYAKGGDSSWGRAAQLADQALDLDPNNAHALLLCGAIYSELGNDDTAAKRLERLMRVDAQYSNTSIQGSYQKGIVYVLLGSAYQNTKQSEKALKLYEEYLRVFPEGNLSGDVRKLVNTLKRSL